MHAFSDHVKKTLFRGRKLQLGKIQRRLITHLKSINRYSRASQQHLRPIPMASMCRELILPHSWMVVWHHQNVARALLNLQMISSIMILETAFIWKSHILFWHLCTMKSSKNVKQKRERDLSSLFFYSARLLRCPFDLLVIL